VSSRRRYNIGDKVLLNTAALFASPVRTEKWIEAEIKDRTPTKASPRYWVFHDCGSPLWVSDHMLKGVEQ